MNKAFVVAICALALLASEAMARQKKSDANTRPASTETSRDQFGGNPFAGGGTTGSSQATNSPKASNEIGGGK